MVNDRPERDRLTCLPTGAAIGRRAALAGAVALCAELGALPARTQMAPESTRTRPQPGFPEDDSGTCMPTPTESSMINNV